MPIDEKKLLQKIKEKDKEIAELKQLLAEAESEIKELNDFHGFQKPRPGILESKFLNKLIKRAVFLLIMAAIIFIGVYPWLFKDKILSNNSNNQESSAESAGDVKDAPLAAEDSADNPENNGQTATSTLAAAETTSATKDIFKPQNLLIVKSDLGWLNVRTEPNAENSKIIKKINSNEEYEWLEKTDNNWYKIKLDKEGHTGYVSGEYVEIK
ncbi:hypothetical protein COU00_00240 [Candidatus Falkowbacteria bacterium CG10_big_fil_rev_8_21_14_0_10_43_11]|uniref:SH3b domain-containing protein n=1 Tax=Candidatus Falkowbacteria bacterium CG10_big_fil_rev_8_21_14_0_10_43_11 TaxID=1974568 RepID=A0A2M6WN86_9BACT|nr:MAG: hypothetical protein COU00_00240 [Candidatus Falkowbacteria bacterium CG10_big_fil_rev_8_21_14_0_10_43_11]